MAPSRRSAIADALRNRIKRAVETGALQPGQRLPSTREVAADVGADPRVVAAAYRQLEPSRLVEAFPLRDVVLERDSSGRDTPFIRNRDKFVRGLAATNPDSFLYNFRDAFGQPQPAGVGGAKCPWRAELRAVRSL